MWIPPGEKHSAAGKKTDQDFLCRNVTQRHIVVRRYEVIVICVSRDWKQTGKVARLYSKRRSSLEIITS